MKSSDVRRLCIRRRMRVHFLLPSGVECTIDEHGATQCKRGDAFAGAGLAKLFSRIQHFTLEMNPGAAAHRMTISRRELEQLAVEVETEVKT